ncbi:Lipoprotein [Flavobacterium branchiophilum]|uniref:Uncharacterized protein n=1 Tax=Flavobacterium branchiophilum (strain FL-15) TaxID=1034807 RepID=G2Z571_FLABF|nr:DUF3997 domain-containing protein [Flavobacterium branchiophilum]CCB68577.1 Hypothetical protein FBFL15_0455 [Flavobacterium branchiophilum FL-15]
MKKTTLIIYLLCSSCKFESDDINVNLGKDYLCIKKGTLTEIYANDSYGFGQGIYPFVKNFAFDKEFIIIEQETKKKEIVISFTEKLRGKYGFLLYMKDSIKITKDVEKFMQSKIWTDSIWHKEISREILPESNVRSFDTLGKIASKIIKEDPYFKEMFSRKINYYIIDKQKQEVYGPFSKENYLTKRKELKVSETLFFE